MKWFKRGKSNKDQSPGDSATGKQVQCSHPIAYQVVMREDSALPSRATGIKCTQCGQVLSTEPFTKGSEKQAS